MDDMTVIPIQPTRDPDRTAAFYARLGFEEIGRDGGYLLMRRGRFEVHFTDHGDFFDPARNPCGLYLRLEAVDALAAQVPDLILGGGAPEHKPWGMYEFALSDPDETLVRVGWPSHLGATR